MSTTQITTSNALAVKAFSVALFAATQRQPTLMKNLTGAAPQQSDAEMKLKGQTSPDYPVVRVTDLSSGPGDKISVDLINIIGGKPIMGDRNAEGKGEKLSFSSMDVSIDLATKVVDAGGKMTQQRTKHNLRRLALAQLGSYMPRMETQTMMVHMAGARGSQQGLDWVVPLQFTPGTSTADDADFGEIMVNTVKAPTYNRHFVCDSTNVLVQGGAQLGSIDSTDIMSLEAIDTLRTYIDDLQFKPQPIRFSDDPAADDEPLYVLLVTSRQWNSILTKASGNNWRQFLQNAWVRKSYGTKHPLFNGEPGLWNGILVKKIDRAIRFLPSDYCNIVTSANRYTGTETAQQINASLTAGYAVDRGILLGAQALANVYGKNKSSDYYYGWSENWYNFKRNLEVAGESMSGKAKIRFNVPDGLGNNEPTDHGVLVIDSAVKL